MTRSPSAVALAAPSSSSVRPLVGLGALATALLPLLALLAAAPPARAGAAAPPPRAALPAEDAAPLATSIRDVVVYGSSARVIRTGTVPAGGLYVVSGLPGLLEPESVRVRLAQGSVASVEVQDRHQTAVPSARIQELRDRLQALEREQRAARDQHDVLAITREHLVALLKQEAAVHGEELAQGRPNADAWSANLAFVTGEMAKVQEALRTSDWALAELDTKIADLRAELGQAEGGSVFLRDVLLDVLAPAGTAVEVEYLVGRAGWQPQYDLRTAADARSVDVVYRARIWQQTGEDWGDVALLLSTARPQRGAQGPDPRPLKVDIMKPVPAAASHLTGRRASTAKLDAETRETLEQLGYVSGDEADAYEPFAFVNYGASVESQGLSVQFRLPRKETIVSRERPSTVLIGQETLEVRPEHVVVPALDTTVWLRGHTKNATAWVLLPGPASVYFGNDFIGQSTFSQPVQPEQEFVLHLGADPGLAVEREQVEDLTEEPGFLSKRKVHTAGWRITVLNHGGHPSAQDGSVAVTVREAVPVPADDRIEVSVLDETHKPVTDVEEYAADLKEGGVRTWSVRVPKGGKVDVGYRVRTAWPHDQTLVTR